MKLLLPRYYFRSLTVFLLLSVTAFSQAGFCPDNINFERGTFANWNCYYGTVKLDPTTSDNIIAWSGFAPSAGSHTIVPSTPNLDFYGRFPIKCPNGSNYSVILGNSSAGASAEGISYIFTIPPGSDLFSITFRYAVVLENPNHGMEEQPRFRARIINQTDNELLQCMSLDFTASSGLPGFKVSPIADSILYKDWTPVTYNLNGMAGKTIKAEFITSDCTRGGHFGYAYLDIDTRCSGPIGGTYICTGDDGTTLVGPDGYSNYTWYSDLSYSSVVSTDQTLALTPAPVSGSIYPLIVVPFSGFGCMDTLFAEIEAVTSPVAQAGPDTISCTYGGTLLGGPHDPALIYQWSPANLLSKPDTSQPFTSPGISSTQTFTLRVVDQITGCDNTDQVVVEPIFINGEITRTGGIAFCADSLINTQLNAATDGSTIQWFQDNTAIPGAISETYDPRPEFTSTFWAQLAKRGCFDTTNKVTIKIWPNPEPAFTTAQNEFCTNFPTRFVNSSVVSPQEAMFYTWKVNGKILSQLKNPELLFDQGGLVNIQLLASTAFGCKDSTARQIVVIDDCGIYVPTGFTPNNDGTNDILRPLLSGAKKLHRFSIYNRAGMQVYTTSVIGEGWNGKVKGLEQGSGVYVWILEYDSADQQKIIRKGTTTLIR